VTIGLVVEGVSEFESLPFITAKFAADLPDALRRPVKANIQPAAPVAVIARECARAVRQLEDRVDRAVIVLDREDRQECCGDLATGIANLVRPNVRCGVDVVLKNSKYENWLVADFDAIQTMGARFRVTDGDRRQIVPNRADSIDAYALLRRAAIREAYDKVRDSVRIARVASPDRIAQNSRSFRRFLRVVRHIRYRTQSARPVPA